METIWVSEWVKRLLQRQKDLGAAAQRTVFFCDRSPYSAVFYSQRDGHLLSPLIAAQLDELREQAGIQIFTVYLKTKPELLWERIQKRLSDEPFRAMYNEGSREWMDKTVSFYEGREWDYILHNNDVTIPEVLQMLLRLLDENLDNFSQYFDNDDCSASSSPACSSTDDSDAPSMTIARKRTTAEAPTDLTDESSKARCGLTEEFHRPLKKPSTVSQKSV